MDTRRLRKGVPAGIPGGVPAREIFRPYPKKVRPGSSRQRPGTHGVAPCMRQSWRTPSRIRSRICPGNHRERPGTGRERPGRAPSVPENADSPGEVRIDAAARPSAVMEIPERLVLHPTAHPVPRVHRAGFPLEHPYLEQTTGVVQIFDSLECASVATREALR